MDLYADLSATKARATRHAWHARPDAAVQKESKLMREGGCNE